MKERLKRIPIATSGIMLAYATLGFLLKDVSGTVYHLCSVIAAVLFVILGLRILLCFDTIKEEVVDPVKCSVTATFSMGMMLLCDYAKPVLGVYDTFFWMIAVILHLCLFLYFIANHLIRFELKNIYASFFIFFAGLSTIADTAPLFGLREMGVWFSRGSMVLVLVMFFVITVRYWKLPKVEKKNKALIGTYTSPFSLLIVGYMACDTTLQLWLVSALSFISFVLYVFATYQMVRILPKGFYPSFASFTFPFVVSALAMKRVSEYIVTLDGISFLEWTKVVYPVQMVLGVSLLGYVSVRFMNSYLIGNRN